MMSKGCARDYQSLDLLDFTNNYHLLVLVLLAPNGNCWTTLSTLRMLLGYRPTSAINQCKLKPFLRWEG